MIKRYSPLRQSSSRYDKTENHRNATCPCCPRVVPEMVLHTLFKCPAFDDEREAFMGELRQARPGADVVPHERLLRELMGDDGSPRIDFALYRVLMAVENRRSEILEE